MPSSRQPVPKGGWMLIVPSPGREAASAGKGAFPRLTRWLNLIAAPGFADAAPGWCCGSSLLGLSAAKCQECRLLCVQAPYPHFFPCCCLAFHPFPVLFMFRHTCSFHASSKGTAGTALLELQTLQGNNGFQTTTIIFPLQ